MKRWLTILWHCFWRGGWMPALVLMMHAVGVYGFDAYRRWPAYDIPMHFAGGLAIAAFALSSIEVLSEHRVIRPVERPVQWVLAFALTATAAVHWEFAEWVADLTIHLDTQMGLDDTILDMLLGVMGGVLVLIGSAVVHSRAVCENQERRV